MSAGIQIQPGKEYNEQADKFWSFYVAEADLYDSNRIGTWKSDLKNTLIFAGLFSASVTAFIIEGQKLLKQDPVNVTNHLLTQLLAAQQSGTTISNSSMPLPSSIPAFPFKPSGSAIAVNILWFTSLVVTLSAALLCILFLQAVQHFSRRVQQQSQPLRRARVRAFLAEGVGRWNVEILVNYIPTFLHVSLFLFLAGLIVFLVDLCIPVSAVVAALVAVLIIIYTVATLAPVSDLASPFETLLLRTSARELSALNPDVSISSSSRDASAFKWARDTITGDHQFETFLETIPGFLTSQTGRNTWESVFHDSSQLLQPQICQLLMSCSRTNYMDPDVRQRRALACIEALSSISRYERQHFPLRMTEKVTIPHLSVYIATAIATQTRNPLPITKGICALALLTRQNFIAKFVNTNGQISPPENVLPLSQEADKALRNLDAWRHKLEAELKKYLIRSEDYQMDIQNLVKDYFDELNTWSQCLVNWRTTIFPFLVEHEEEKHHDLFRWCHILPDNLYLLLYRNILGADTMQVQVKLYALQVMVFMRQIGVYALLPEMTSSPFSNARELDPALCQELEPISRLITLLEPSLTSDHIQFLNRDMPFIFIYDYPVPKEPPMLAEHLGPFSTIGFVLEDVRNQAPVVTLIDLVMRFKSFAPQVVEPHIIREFLEDIFSGSSDSTPYTPASSQTLFVALMRVILDWEKVSRPCPFSPSDITFLLKLLRNVSSESGVDAAARLFMPSYNNPGVNTGNHKTRMDAICNHIRGGRPASGCLGRSPV